MPAKIGIVLCKPNYGSSQESHSCVLTICGKHIHHNLLITAVDVLSESKHIEIQHANGEYVTTQRGMLIDDLNQDKKVYMCQNTFEKPLRLCKVKVRRFCTCFMII